MERRIRESDWKRLRQLAPAALDRFCERVLSEVVRLSADDATSAHDRYLAVFKLMREKDEELEAAFDNPRRSTAFLQLVQLRALELIGDDEFAKFSAETQAAVATYLQIWQVRRRDQLGAGHPV